MNTGKNLWLRGALAAVLSAVFLLLGNTGQGISLPVAEAQAARGKRLRARLPICAAGQEVGRSQPLGCPRHPAEYDEIASYSADAVAVRQGKSWGIVRLDGTVIVPVAYKTIQPLSNDMIVVQDAKSNYGAYNTGGKLILPAEYLNISPFNDGISRVQRRIRNTFFIGRTAAC